MATTTLDQGLEETQEKAQPRSRSLAGLLRKILIVTPFLLFAAAIFTGLGFYTTNLPLLGQIAAGLALAGGIFTIGLAWSLSDS